jgi:hypothetical protein
LTAATPNARLGGPYDVASPRPPPLSATAKRGTWTYVGVGCAVVGFGVLAAVVALGYWFYRSADRMRHEMTDAGSREAKAKAVLGCTEIPAGYHASLAVSIPFVMDMAILGDREPEIGKDGRLFERRGFVYVKTLRHRSAADVEKFFEGKAAVDQIVPGAGVTISEGEEIGRGILSRGDVTIRYLSRKGTLTTRGQSVAGINSFLLFECPGDSRSRMGIWFGPDTAEGTSGPERYAGTPADESAIRDFTSHLFPCAS